MSITKNKKEERNWKIKKQTLNELSKKIRNQKVTDPFSILQELYFLLLENKTKKQYLNLSVLKDFKTKAEQDFIVILPKLIASGRIDDVRQLIGLIKRSICLYVNNKQRSYKTYLKTFIDFLDRFINSGAQANQEVTKMIISLFQSRNDYILSQEEENALQDAFSKREIFLHDTLYTKFKSRLRSQNRVSGDKVWLPLGYIAKLYKIAKNDGFSNWLENLVNNIYIHYLHEDKGIKSVSFGTDVFLDFEKNNSNTYDVYVIWSKSQVQKRHRVLTPTGKGNEKVPMTVKSISEIDIDHVKAIDKTLRDLEKKEKLPNLTKVSDSFKLYMERISAPDSTDDNKKFENNTLVKLLKTIDIEKLTEELQAIRKDSILRLMDSNYNSQKSNGSTFIRIHKQSGKYKGIILEKITYDEGNKEITLYQNLDENGIIRATPNPIEGRKVSISKKIIDLL